MVKISKEHKAILILISLQLILLAFNKIYIGYHSKSLAKAGFDNMVIIEGNIFEESDVKSVRLTTHMPIFDKASLDALSAMPYVNSAYEVSYKYFDLEVDDKEYTTVKVIAANKDFLSTHMLSMDPNKKIFIASGYFDETIPETVTLKTPRGIKETLVKYNKDFIEDPQVLDFEVLAFKPSEGEMLNKLIVLDREFAYENFATVLIEPTAVFVKIDDSVSNVTGKKIIDKFISNSSNSGIDGMEYETFLSQDYFKSSIDIKILEKIQTWSGFIVLILVFGLTIFSELAAFNRKRQEVAIRKIHGQSNLSSVYYSLKSSLLTFIGIGIGVIAVTTLTIFLITKWLSLGNALTLSEVSISVIALLLTVVFSSLSYILSTTRNIGVILSND